MPDDETRHNETMTTSEVAEYLCMTTDGAHKWLRRRGIESVGRARGRAAQNLYRRSDVTGATSPGRGYRRDLHGPPGPERTTGTKQC